jgi:hypothetical protein
LQTGVGMIAMGKDEELDVVIVFAGDIGEDFEFYDCPFIIGSSASRSPSPTKVKANMIRAMHIAGAMSSHTCE